MKEAFIYMFKDNKFWLKALILLVLSIGIDLTNMPDIIALISMFLSFIFVGYYISCIKSLIVQQQNYVLPKINVFKNMFLGIKSFLAILLAFLPIILLNFISTFLYKFLIYVVWNSDNINIIAVVFKIITALTVLITAIALIFYFIFYTGYIWMFANKSSLLTAYKLKDLFNLVSQDKKTYFKNAGKVILFTIIAILINGVILYFLENITLLAVIASSSFSVYAFFVMAFLIAKSFPKQHSEL